MASYRPIRGSKHHSLPDPDENIGATMKTAAMILLVALFAVLVWWKFGFWWV